MLTRLDRHTELLLGLQAAHQRNTDILLGIQLKVKEMHGRPQHQQCSVKPWLSLSDAVKLVITFLILWSALRGDMTMQEAATLLR